MNGVDQLPLSRDRRGRDADAPSAIPLSGWSDVFQRVKVRLGRDHLSITAAGVAFYALIATFPGMLALLEAYGLLFEADQISEQLKFIQAQIQPDAVILLDSLIRGLGQSRRFASGFGIVGGALASLWGASLGVRALIRALNLAYGETEVRTLLHRHGVSLLLTFGAVVASFCMASILLSGPLFDHWLTPGGWGSRLAFRARWPAVGLIFWLSLMLFYRFAPSRTPARWSWLSWGAMCGTALWLSGTGGLAWYVADSRIYHDAYGSLGIVVLVLIWFLLTSYSVLLGAEINAELERQTRRDTTIGPEEPLGRRGANAADTLGGRP